MSIVIKVIPWLENKLISLLIHCWGGGGGGWKIQHEKRKWVIGRWGENISFLQVLTCSIIVITSSTEFNSEWNNSDSGKYWDWRDCYVLEGRGWGGLCVFPIDNMLISWDTHCIYSLCIIICNTIEYVIDDNLESELFFLLLLILCQIQILSDDRIPFIILISSSYNIPNWYNLNLFLRVICIHINLDWNFSLSLSFNLSPPTWHPTSIPRWQNTLFEFLTMGEMTC